MISRLLGNAVIYTIERRKRGFINFYKTVNEVLDQLAEIYEDIDLLHNAERELNALTMTKTFQSFIAKFLRLGYIVKYDEDYLMRLLKEKLPPRLLKGLQYSGLRHEFGSLKEMKSFLTALDNSQRLNAYLATCYRCGKVGHKSYKCDLEKQTKAGHEAQINDQEEPDMDPSSDSENE